MTVDQARSLLAVEADLCDADRRLTELARRIELAGLPHGARFAALVKRSRRTLRKALCGASGQVADAVSAVEAADADLVPF